MRLSRHIRITIKLLLAICASLSGARAQGRPAPARLPGPELAHGAAPAWTRSPLRFIESLFERARRTQDQIDVTVASGQTTSARGVPLATLEADYARLTDSLRLLRASLDTSRLSTTDRAALAAITKAKLGDVTYQRRAVTDAQCAYDAPRLLADSGVRALRARIAHCYRRATENVRVGDSTFNRLGVLGRLGWESDRELRRAMWLALDTVWSAMNGDRAPTSPWRTLIAVESKGWTEGNRPLDRSARALGYTSEQVELAMYSLLEAWRTATPKELIEPWDYWYQNGEASRALASRIPRTRLLELNAAYYRALGVDLASFNTHYDIDPRPGQTPVAYTTFGDRPRWENGAWESAEPWIFATYADGGLDILNELLHESGHAAHIAAIRTRPAYADWPDANVFTEGIADIVALDVYEPTWQQRWLGDSVPTAVGLRARYGGIMLDAAWSLFEIKMERTPLADPNLTWMEITQHYLHIAPHPERSWWAMRAQLFDLPGYMLNYAMGAIVVADVRATLRARHGDWLAGDPRWYGRASEALFKFGREVPARTVLTRFLGRPASAAALTRDLARMRSAVQNSGR